MTIKAKILSLVAAFAVLAIAITGLALKTMADYDRIIADYDHASENAFRGERLNRYLTTAAMEGRAVYAAKTPEAIRAAADQVDVRANLLTAFITDWAKELKPGELPEFTKVEPYVLDFATDGHTVARLARNEGLDSARAFGNHDIFRVHRENTQADIDAMVARINAQQARSHDAMDRFRSERQTQFLVMASIGILLLVLGSLWIVIDSITNPLDRVRQSMIRISKGEYDTALPTSEQSDAMGTEIGELWRALGVLKAHAIEAERLSDEKLKEEQALRELVLD
ncbi:MAG: hypothetical protein QM647_10680 [Asticcacaulis sp.]|uniref:hypothetical protein n=1 Tax=Asticcacaulis sp. TaxID=1872648 RepID=UPI0039E4FBDA